MKKFSEMSAAERQKWVSGEVDSGNVTSTDRTRPVCDRIQSALADFGPMTTKELAEKMGYRNYESLTTWSNRPDNKAKLAEAGIMKHVSPDDGLSRIWFLDSHVRLEEEPVREHRAPVFNAMKSSGG